MVATAVVFEEQWSELLQNRHVIEAELREALRRGDQLSVAFQPLYGADSLQGHWRRSAGALAPSAPAVETRRPTSFPSPKVLASLKRWVILCLSGACELGAKWPGHMIAVNVSPTRSSGNRKFPERVFAVLRDTGMRPEDWSSKSPRTSCSRKLMPRARPFICSVPKACASRSTTSVRATSLNYLKRYPVDRIKIDRSFVSQLAPGSVSNAIVEAMVRAGARLEDRSHGRGCRN